MAKKIKRYEPHKFVAAPSINNIGLRNPALTRDNGVLKSYCVVCGRLIGDENTMNWYSLIRREYCSDCKKKVVELQNASRQRIHRSNLKKEKRELVHQNTLLKMENKLLREAVAALRDDVDQLKNT